MLLGNEHPRKTVLIVDDEEVIRKLCARALSSYHTLEAENGVDALEVLRRESVDLILTDIMMPEMGGIELLKAVKETSPNQVVVMMTGFDDKELILQSLKANANDFITKPLSLLHLNTTVAKALEWQSLREELVELKHMDRLKSEFLALVSHKLKTPSTSISLFLQNLADGALDLDDPDCRSALEEARSEVRYLDCLIRDLLYYSDVILQEGDLQLETILPGVLVCDAVTASQKSAAERGVQLQATLPNPAPPPAPLDRKRITFVLRALIENAVKFSPAGSTVTIKLSSRAAELCIAIEDNGIGIRAEELPKIFEKFYQVDPAHTGQVRGFGLGLFYARQFVQRHGGTLQIASTPGKGTTATVIIPANPAAPA